MCEHLQALENDLKSNGIAETFRGQAWSDNCREWVYYDCVLDTEKLMIKYQFPPCVQIHVNNDIRSGMEAGFYCDQCKDAIMGMHPQMGNGKLVFG